MPARSEVARRALAAFVLAAGALASARAGAEPLAIAKSPTPPAADGRWRSELMGGVDGPLGNVGAALVFSARPWLQLGGGFGVGLASVTPDYPGSNARAGNLAAGVFARANVLRVGRLALGPVATASLAQRRARMVAQRPQFVDPDSITWSWSPGPRFDLGLGAEVAVGDWTLRLEGGLGVVVGEPTCRYAAHPNDPFPFVGACDSAEIPSEYHFSREPGRLAPYLTLGVAPPAAGAESAPPARQVDPRADAAFAAPTALTAPRGSVTATLYELLLLRVTYGVTDRLQLSVGAAFTVFAGFPAWNVGAKLAIFEVGRLHVALAAEHLGAQGSYTGGTATGAGPVASFCLDSACASIISTSVAFGVVTMDNDESADTTESGTLISPSVVLALGSHLKAVGELHLALHGAVDGAWIAALRAPFSRFAVDLGAMGEVHTGELAPVGSASVRW